MSTKTVSELLIDLQKWVPRHEASRILGALLSERIKETAVDMGSAIRLQWEANPWSPAQLALHRSDTVPARVCDHAVAFAKKRAGGAILQHLLGYETFLDHDFAVGPEVLVPRPETEGLVLGLESRLKGWGAPTGVEVGAGSGAIGIELVARNSSLKIVVTELSDAAIEVAEANASRILGENATGVRWKIVKTQRPEWVLEPLMDAVSGLDFVVSNPPYLLGAEEVDLDVASHEPALALYAPKNDVNYFYRVLASQGTKVLKNGGWLAVELPHERAKEIESIFLSTGWKASLEFDLTGRARYLFAQKLGDSDG